MGNSISLPFEGKDSYVETFKHNHSRMSHDNFEDAIRTWLRSRTKDEFRKDRNELVHKSKINWEMVRGKNMFDLWGSKHFAEYELIKDMVRYCNVETEERKFNESKQ